MFRLLIAGVCLFALWDGFDGLRVNLASDGLERFSIGEVESEGVGSARYVEITNAFPAGSYVVSSEEGSGDVDRVIFPVTTVTNAQKRLEGEGKASRVYIERDSFGNGCSELNDYCIAVEPTTYKGVTKVGFDALDSETKDLFAGSGQQFPEDVVLIDENSKPRSMALNATILGGAVLGLALVGASVFRGRNDAPDDETQQLLHDTLLRVMSLVALADDRIEDAEVQTIADIHAQLTGAGADPDRVRNEIEATRREGQGIAAYLSKVRDSLTDDGKVLVLKAAAMVAAADGSVDQAESERLAEVANTLGMSRDQAMDSVKDILGREE